MTDLRPVEFNVVVELDKTEDKTAGGIYLPPAVADREKLAAEEGVLVAVSPHAFTYAEWASDNQMPKVGDRVLIAKFGGVQRDRHGSTFRLIKDKDILAVIDGPQAVAAAA